MSSVDHFSTFVGPLVHQENNRLLELSGIAGLLQAHDRLFLGIRIVVGDGLAVFEDEVLASGGTRQKGSRAASAGQPGSSASLSRWRAARWSGV